MPTQSEFAYVSVRHHEKPQDSSNPAAFLSVQHGRQSTTT
jgi:hypothetical protein